VVSRRKNYKFVTRVPVSCGAKKPSRTRYVVPERVTVLREHGLAFNQTAVMVYRARAEKFSGGRRGGGGYEARRSLRPRTRYYPVTPEHLVQITRAAGLAMNVRSSLILHSSCIENSQWCRHFAHWHTRERVQGRATVVIIFPQKIPKIAFPANRD
jgi:hypothetical protein